MYNSLRYILLHCSSNLQLCCFQFEMLKCLYIFQIKIWKFTASANQWWTYIVKFWTRITLPGPNFFFISMQFLGKFGQIIGWRPLGNPGSAAANTLKGSTECPSRCEINVFISWCMHGGPGLGMEKELPAGRKVIDLPRQEGSPLFANRNWSLRLYRGTRRQLNGNLAQNRRTSIRFGAIMEVHPAL